MRILITGATSGIAYQLGCFLSKRNHTVYLTTHTEEQLKQLKTKLKEDNIQALCFKMDITTEDINIIDNIKIDCLVNHAGIGIGGSLLAMDMEDVKQNYEVNVFSSFHLLKRVYQKMEREKIPGKLFVMSSAAAYLPFPFLGCYTSSKASISMLCKTIRKELAYLKSNISITVVEPGAYKTGFNQVMIDNKSKYLEEDSLFYQETSKINRLQRNLFSLLEKEDPTDLVEKIAQEIESPHPKFRIRRPKLLTIFLKIYFLLFY